MDKPQKKRRRKNRPDGSYMATVTADTPLTPEEQMFVTEYIRTSSAVEAFEASGIKFRKEERRRGLEYGGRTSMILKRPNVQAEIQRIMNELKQESLATAQEVMEYFTSVMRGEIKDQFGLDAPLTERTRAAQELAKRTIDIENRQKGNADQAIEIKLDWSRK